MEKVQVPNSQFFALVRQLLLNGKKIEITVKGDSMCPFLFDGETVVVVPVRVDCPFSKCDIILAETTPGQYMMHRIRSITPSGILMKGDGNLHQSEWIHHANVLGKVVSVVRNGRPVDLYSPLLLLLARMWNPLFVRKVGLFILQKFYVSKSKKGLIL